MSHQFVIQLTPEAHRVVANLQTLPPRILQAIASALGKENQLTVSHIQAEHLTGVGPFPVEQHKLGIRTGRLRSSVRATEPVINGQTVDSSIGSNVVYAAIHEFGGWIYQRARERTIRLKTDARGNLIRQLKNSHLAVFARKGAKRVREVNTKSESHNIQMPERAPFRTGIAECAPNYNRSISAAIVREWNKPK